MATWLRAITARRCATGIWYVHLGKLGPCSNKNRSQFKVITNGAAVHSYYLFIYTRILYIYTAYKYLYLFDKFITKEMLACSQSTHIIVHAPTSRRIARRMSQSAVAQARC